MTGNVLFYLGLGTVFLIGGITIGKTIGGLFRRMYDRSLLMREQIEAEKVARRMYYAERRLDDIRAEAEQEMWEASMFGDTSGQWDDWLNR